MLQNEIKNVEITECSGISVAIGTLAMIEVKYAQHFAVLILLYPPAIIQINIL